MSPPSGYRRARIRAASKRLPPKQAAEAMVARYSEWGSPLGGLRVAADMAFDHMMSYPPGSEGRRYWKEVVDELDEMKKGA